MAVHTYIHYWFTGDHVYNVNWNGTVNCYDAVQVMKSTMQSSARHKALLLRLWLQMEDFISLTNRELFTSLTMAHTFKSNLKKYL